MKTNQEVRFKYFFSTILRSRAYINISRRPLPDEQKIPQQN